MIDFLYQNSTQVILVFIYLGILVVSFLFVYASKKLINMFCEEKKLSEQQSDLDSIERRRRKRQSYKSDHDESLNTRNNCDSVSVSKSL